MDKTRDCDLDQCCNKYKEQFVALFKSMAITKATSKKNPLYIAERNQSVYFYNAVKSVYSEAIAWFEFPFDNNQHLDALIFIPKSSKLDHNQVLLVESKNMRTLSKKIPEMIEDVHRIGLTNAQEHGALKSKLKALFKDFKETSFFGVILCDVQKTSKDHMDFVNQWEDADLIEQYISSKIGQKDRTAVKTWIDDSTAKRLTQTIFYEGNEKKPIPYEQLIRYWTIKT